MSAGFGLIYVTPFPPRAASLPSRPRALLQQLREEGRIRRLSIVGRLRPSAFFRQRDGRRGVMGSRLVRVTDREQVIEHPWPFGRLEEEMLRRVALDHLSEGSHRWVLWVSDPKSATVFGRLRQIPGTRLVWVFDAYDAWDLSPLVRGRRRQRAVTNGYRAAARFADVIFANTEFMAQRMEGLGAAKVSMLQNAAPHIDYAAGRRENPDGEPYLLYIGRIHERVDAGLLAAVADAFPLVPIRLIGPVERTPDGWPALIARPNVGLEGQIVGERLHSILANATALLLPHRVDDYTRSQDAMKAWDALAVGTPVVATPVPPVVGWPAGLATVGPDRDTFIAGVRSALEGDREADRELRLRFARENGWDARAATAIRVIEEILDA